MAELQLKTPIILALDVDDVQTARNLAGQLSFGLGAIKLGPRLLIQYGASLVSEMARLCPVFVDNKYFDIPNTMVSAVRQTFEAGATFATVHALSGSEALTQLAELEQELNQERSFKILSVTVLTSFSQQTLPSPLATTPIKEHVESLAQLTVSSGLSGLVCSPFEVESLRKAHKGTFLVTPGIRFEDSKADDQKRVMTAKEALRRGASALVVGRPLLQAENPVKKLEQILGDL